MHPVSWTKNRLRLNWLPLTAFWKGLISSVTHHSLHYCWSLVSLKHILRLICWVYVCMNSCNCIWLTLLLSIYSTASSCTCFVFTPLRQFKDTQLLDPWSKIIIKSNINAGTHSNIHFTFQPWDPTLFHNALDYRLLSQTHHWTICLAPGQLRSSLSIITFCSVTNAVMFILLCYYHTMFKKKILQRENPPYLPHIYCHKLSLERGPWGMWW